MSCGQKTALGLPCGPIPGGGRALCAVCYKAFAHVPRKSYRLTVVGEWPSQNQGDSLIRAEGHYRGRGGRRRADIETIRDRFALAFQLAARSASLPRRPLVPPVRIHAILRGSKADADAAARCAKWALDDTVKWGALTRDGRDEVEEVTLRSYVGPRNARPALLFSIHEGCP